MPSPSEQRFTLVSADARPTLRVGLFARTVATASLVTVVATSACVLLGSRASAADPELEWVRLKNQSFFTAEEVADAVLRDGGGVVVTGIVRSLDDGAVKTLAISENGDPLWTAIYQIPGGYATARCIARDDAGNVFVAGAWREGPELLLDSPSPFNIFRFLLLKYQEDGELVFEARDEFPGVVRAQAVDIESGEVAIAGRCPAGACAQNIGIRKYSPDGDLLWSREFDGPLGLEENVSEMQFGAGGALFLVGTVDEDPEEEEDTVTAGLLLQRYSADGDLVWTARFDGEGYSGGSALVVGEERVYVAGVTRNAVRESFYVTAAFDAGSGESVWSDVVPASDRRDFDRQVGRMPGGDLLVAGRRQVLRYTSGGERLWSRQSEFDGIPALALGTGGAVYTAGVPDDGEREWGVERLMSTGEREWLKTFSEPEAESSRVVKLLAGELGPGVYAIGSSRDDVPPGRFVVRRLDANGDVVWERRSSDRIDSSRDRGLSIVRSATGGVVVRAHLAEDYAVVRYQRDGEELPTARLSAFFPQGESSGFAMLSDGAVVVTGVRRGDAETLVFEVDGTLRWRSVIDTGGFDIGRAVVVDGDDRIYLAARPQAQEGLLLVAYSPQGDELWRRSEDTNGSTLGPAALDASSSGRLAVTGGLRTSSGVPRRLRNGLLTVVYDSSGERIWRREIPGNEFELFTGRRIALDNADNVYVAAAHDKGARPDEVLLLKYSPAGDELWRLGTVGEEPRGLLVTPDGSRVLVGYSAPTETADLDLEVVCLDPDGRELWRWRLGEFGEDRLRGLALGPRGVFVTGFLERAESDADIVTAGLTLAGVEEWIVEYSGDGASDDRSEAISVDASGRLCVTGSSSFDMVTLCYSTEAVSFRRGDCDGDGETNGLTDAVFLLNHNFLQGPASPCLAACDANADGNTVGQVTDAVYLLTHGFLEGPPPPPPYPACGTDDSTASAALGCATGC